MQDTDCQKCFFSQIPTVNDRFFEEAVKPYSWFSAVLLFVSYLIGLWFTLRTHAAVIWNESEEKKVPNAAVGPAGVIQSSHAIARKTSATNISSASPHAVRDSQLYKRILGQSLKQIGLDPTQNEDGQRSTFEDGTSSLENSVPHLVPPKDSKAKDAASFIDGLSSEQNEHLVRQVAEVAATAATVAARDAFRSPKLVHGGVTPGGTSHPGKKAPSAPHTVIGEGETHTEEHDAHAGGGHDAPNWSRLKSTVILLGATLLYAIIAEILVNTVDVVLENVDIDEKFLGITLFALVPNTTEFLVS
jgi:Ca2+:H+ antiporter